MDKIFPGTAAAPASMDAQEDQGELSVAGDDPVSFEELAALDAESQRLKRLLAKQLHQENLQLKKMLERLDLTETVNK
ncbi:MULTISPECIES: hypothetical protein [unclassified Sinorhizobium]|uniref:hypothetical protein n=1 Tax=unclassified Sinorhizobium TaxID=2613772 RepID=UPI00352377B0